MVVMTMGWTSQREATPLAPTRKLQQNIVALRPIRGDMFIESPTPKKVFLAPAERNIVWSPRTNHGNIALRWSASYGVRSSIYKHLAPLERKLIPLLHLKVETKSDRTRRNSVMRKIIVLEHISLDGVIQAPGGPDEATSDGFAYGGGAGPYK